MTTAPAPAERMAEIAAGLEAVRRRIDAARSAAGRADEVALVVVTKTFPPEDVAMLAALGVVDVGENRDQEARAKKAQCPTPTLRWHMIGQLQRNKATSVARWADVVESVDRVELASALGRAAAAAGRRLDVLIQVALDRDPSPGRGGAVPADVPALAQAIVAEPALDLRGVMGVAPLGGDADEAFGRLHGVSARLVDAFPAADRISAGMSGDLEQAIGHGATQVRVGGAVLGARSRVQ